MNSKLKVYYNNYNLIINTDYNNILTKKYFYKKILKTYNSRIQQ